MCWLAIIAALLATPATAQQAERGTPPPITIPAPGAFPVYRNPSISQGLPPAPTEQVVAGLSHQDIQITTSFDGSDLIIYGAVKRERPIPPAPLDVIVTLAGPATGVTVRKKERVFGVWMNRESLHVTSAPTYYAVASTRPLQDILAPGVNARFRISVAQAIRAYASELPGDQVTAFTEALMDLRLTSGAYRDDAAVTLTEDTLFRADLRLPANLVEGDYKVRIFLVRDGQVVDAYSAPIEVYKVGLERWLYRLAFDQPLAYGLLSLALAVAAGWGASAAFRMIRRA